MTDREDERMATEFVRRHSLESVRVVFTDLHGVLRGKVFSASEYIRRFRRGVRFCESIFAKDISGARVEATSLGLGDGAHDLLAVPDPLTYSVMPWQPGMGQVIADIESLDGSLVSYAPRVALRRVLDMVAARDLVTRVGTELEFYVLSPEAGRPTLTSTQAYDVTRLVGHGTFLDSTLSALANMSLAVESLHRESGPGQFEITLPPMDALRMADATVLLKNVIKEIAMKHAVIATFMAKPFTEWAGSGFHIHHSLWDRSARTNVFASPTQPGPSDLALRFIAGELAHLPAATAFFAPSVNAYKRLQRDSAAPVNCTWGYDNRTVALRVPEAEGAASQLENRVPGADANPYLTVAALLAGGLLGLRHGTAVPLPVDGDACEATDAQRLPRNLGEALSALDADDDFKELLHPRLVEVMLALKRAEWARYERQVNGWERDTYLDLL